MFTDTISTISYSGGAILFALFFFIAIYSALKKRTSPSLILPALATTLSLSLVVGTAYYPDIALKIIPLSEILKNGAWFVAILSVLKYASGSEIPRKFYLVIHSLWIALFGLNLLVYPLPGSMPLNTQPIFIWNGLLLSILGLVAVEQLFRNANHERQTKLVSVGVGGLFLYDLYMYAHALVFKQIDQDLWLARGAIHGASALVLSLGIITFSRESVGPSSISISRPIVFYTTSLTMAGFFLALMSAGGYYIKIYGGDWGVILQVLLIFSACITIASLMISRTLRVRLSVFIDKNFFNHKYDYRAEWLKLINQLSQPSAEGDFYSHAISTMASIFKSPGGCIWLRNGLDGYQPVAEVNLKIPTEINCVEPVNSPFCKALKEQEWVFSPNALADDETAKLNELLPEWVSHIPDLWIIIPLLNEEDLIGFMGLATPAVQTPLTWEDLDLMKTAGRQISSYVTRHQAAELLAQSRQFDAFNKLTAFVMHDLKNLIAQQALVVKNAAKHKDNPAFVDDMINTIDNSVNRMNNLLQKLQNQEVTSAQSASIVELDRLLLEAATKCHDRYPIPTIRHLEKKVTVFSDPDHFEMVMIHLIKNAQEATPKDGFVDITLKKQGNMAIIEVEDNGIGMDENFLKHRLFKPFDTTKSGKGMGIGVYQAREFIRAMGGEIRVESTPNQGSKFTVQIPLGR